jgi:ATP-dependent protease ClpP protease subunit
MTQTYPMKCRISNGSSGEPTRVDVYDDIGGGGWFSDGLTAKAFASQLAKVNGPLDVHISSGGGDVGDGIAIGNTIRSHKGFKRTINDGMAASIASVIFQAGDDRIVQPGAMTMIHDAMTLAVGNAADFEKAAAVLDKHSDNIAGIYAGRAGGTVEHWRDVMRAETWYTADEAVAAGLADRVGDGAAELPAGLDLAAFIAIPGRIAARLRSMPQAVAPGCGGGGGDGTQRTVSPSSAGPADAAPPHGASGNDPFTGPHTHSHPALGSQGGDETHQHGHSHDGDADHGHSHAESNQAGDALTAADGDGSPCKTCGGKGRLKHPGSGANGMTCPGCGGSGVYSPPDQGAAGEGTADAAGDAPGDGEQCKTCKGTGKIMQGNRDCPDCDGTGKAPAGQQASTARRILGIESMPLQDKALPVHHTATVDETWDGPAAVAAMPADDTVLTYCHAWENAEAAADPHREGDHDADDQKASYKFPHHKTDGGPANLAACRNGLARLSSADIPAGDDAGVKAHLQAHIDDAKDDGAGNHVHIDLSGVDLDELQNALKGALK